jgi:hypothetical protein
MKKTISMMLCVIIFCTCTSSVRVLKASGETAILTLNNDTQYVGELITVTDTTLFFNYLGTIFQVPFSEVKNVYVKGYSLKGQKVGATVLLMLIDGTIVVLGITSGNLWWSFAFGALIPLTLITFRTSDPKVDFSPSLTDNDLEQLRLYCRYPQGLAQEQWEDLLSYYQQDDFKSLSRE